MYSKTVIVGNLARDPESRKAGETNVTRLVVAVNDVSLPLGLVPDIGWIEPLTAVSGNSNADIFVLIFSYLKC